MSNIWLQNHFRWWNDRPMTTKIPYYQAAKFSEVRLNDVFSYLVSYNQSALTDFHLNGNKKFGQLNLYFIFVLSHSPIVKKKKWHIEDAGLILALTSYKFLILMVLSLSIWQDYMINWILFLLSLFPFWPRFLSFYFSLRKIYILINLPRPSYYIIYTCKKDISIWQHYLWEGYQQEDCK